MAEKIKKLFKEIEEAWSALPGYVKAFLYSFSSSVFGLWMVGQLNWRAVVVIIATNVGIYTAPRVIGEQTKKLL